MDGILTRSSHDFRRWLYLSLQSEMVGETRLPACFTYILGNPVNENWILRFILEQKISGILLYDLHKILPFPEKSSQLADLLALLQGCGVVSIYAVGATERDWIRIGDFHAITGGRYLDGMVTEIEFWNAPSYNFRDFENMLDYMRSVSLSLEGFRPLKVTAYVGALKDASGTPPMRIASALCARTDLIFVQSYSKSPKESYHSSRELVMRINEAAKFLPDRGIVPIAPIYSAEGTCFSAHGGRYMGDWIISEVHLSNDRILRTAEDIYAKLLDADLGDNRYIALEGVSYYSYEFVFFSLYRDRYFRGATPSGTVR